MDPWTELGLDPDHASADEVRAARRRLAKRYHPDLLSGASPADRKAAADRLARVNASVELCLVHIAARDAVVEVEARTVRVHAERPDTSRSSMPPPGAVAGEWAHDEREATFGLDLLPVEAFELVLLGFSAIGDPKVVDEPYLLEGQVDDPYLGHARVTLVPVAGGSLVTVETVPARPGFAPPAPAQVAGRLLAEVKVLRL